MSYSENGDDQHNEEEQVDEERIHEDEIKTELDDILEVQVIEDDQWMSATCSTRKRKACLSRDPLGSRALAFDSGSDDSGDDDDGDDDDIGDSFGTVKKAVRQAVTQGRGVTERISRDEQIGERVDESMSSDLSEDEREDESAEKNQFFWTEDFSSFTGQKETYLRNPGPTFQSQEPVEIFLQFWDEVIMETIVSETNRYAQKIFEQFSDSKIPKYLTCWDNITVDDLYRYFSALIYMSICQRANVQEYWEKGVLEMPKFRDITSRNSFLRVTKFLHFVDNDRMGSGTGYDRKISKVRPILEHCNRKFSSLYIASQHISLDESLLLWKERPSLRQFKRKKAARCGIKSLDLCEAETGYILQCRLYAGRDSAQQPGAPRGFDNIVLETMQGYLDAGHVLVMDNRYNRLSLTRYLKSRKTDVLGTISRGRAGVPKDIKDLNPKQMRRGESAGRHCGDIALVAWKDAKLVTLLSTHHRHDTVARRRVGQNLQKPLAVEDYNRCMRGLDLKDQNLSAYSFEKKRGRKWYMKLFRRLLNISLLNAYIIYTRNAACRVCSHRDFRVRVAEGLLVRFPPPRAASRPLPARPQLRLAGGPHYPAYLPLAEGTSRRKRVRCVRCISLADKKNTKVVTSCALCQVPLCLGKCWVDYHERDDLSKF